MACAKLEGDCRTEIRIRANEARLTPFGHNITRIEGRHKPCSVNLFCFAFKIPRLNLEFPITCLSRRFSIPVILAGTVLLRRSMLVHFLQGSYLIHLYLRDLCVLLMVQ